MTFVALNLLRDKSDLARFFGCAEVDMDRLTADGDQSSFYDRMEIPKKGKRRGRVRIVFKADEALAQVQRGLHQALSEQARFRDFVTAFVPGASIIKNARQHLGQRRLLHLDIENFFDSITDVQVAEVFRAFGCNDEVVHLLTRLATLNGRLPQGSSASPIISNLVCRHLDVDLEQIALSTGCIYTRYADDITISGDHVPPVESLVTLLGKHGFAARAGSIRIQNRGKAQYVTGLSVGASTGPHAPRRMKRRLRLVLHYIERFGVDDHLAHTQRIGSATVVMARLSGLLNFVSSVEARTSWWRAEWLRMRGIPDDESPPDQGS